MTTTASESTRAHSPVVPRQRDRRLAWSELLAALSRSADDRADASRLRGALEEALRHLVPVQTIQLRDRNSRWLIRRPSPPSAESIAFDVPGAEGGGVLEATFAPGSVIGEWDFQVLGLGAHLGALVLESRTRTPPIVALGAGSGADTA